MHNEKRSKGIFLTTQIELMKRTSFDVTSSTGDNPIKNLGHKLTEAVPIFHQIEVTFENSNVAISIWVRGWGMWPETGLGQGMLNLVR